MLVTTLINEASMDILPRVKENFDEILIATHNHEKDYFAKQLEYEDHEIYLWTKRDPFKRFVLIKNQIFY